MSSYLIPNLTDSQVSVLQEAGVAFYVLDQTEQSYIVDGDHLQRALDSLKATATQSPSERYAEVIDLTLTYWGINEKTLVVLDGTRVSVETNGSEMPKEKFLVLIDEIVGPVVGRKIILHLPPVSGKKKKRTRPAFKDEYFHIHIWSSPGGKRRFTPPTAIWGVEVESRERSYGLTGSGIPLVDKDSEYVVGELMENNLYIHHDLLSRCSKSEYELMRLILEKAAQDLNLSPQERRKRLKDRHSEGRQKSRRLYIKACGERINQLIEETRKSLRLKINQLAEIQSHVFGLLRLDVFGGKEIDIEERQTELAAEFDRLREVPRIKSVITAEGVVMLKTEMLCAQHPLTGQSHEIGEFLIVIYLQGGSRIVRWFNSTRRVNGARPAMNSPTIYGDGSPALDEIQETMLELVARLELSVVAELAIQFVETVNDDLLGAHLANWPLALAQSTSSPRN